MSKKDDVILAGDIGGTNARFGCLRRAESGRWNVENFVKVRGVDFPTFDIALGSYLDTLNVRPARAAFAAAGPVKSGHIKLTNMAWDISAQRTQELYGFESCGLYNDFAGMTRSVAELEDDAFTNLRSGTAREDCPVLVAGAGTGFGVGYLIPCAGNGSGAHWQVTSTEGGHVAYSPQTPLEFELLQVLQKTHEYVSVEIVSSGSGLPIIHEAMCQIHGQTYAFLGPDQIRENEEAGDSIASDICRVRANATMGTIGDLALAGGARGGIVLAGGVSERMSDYYMRPEALSRFLTRGPRSDYVKNIPIRLLISAMAPLVGAAALMHESIA